MQAVEGIYRDGHIKLLETPKEIRRARVIVTFLDAETELRGSRESVVNSGEIIADDLEAASREIAESLNRAAEKSARELEN